MQRNFDFMLCLSQFHKAYAHRNQLVPSRKIIVTRNGINPQKLGGDKRPKDENKIVWMSSPDRGLESALLVMDRLVERFPRLELHVYYGFHLLYLYGLAKEADRLKTMLAARPYVKYRGFVEQKQMYGEVVDAVVWLYPCAVSKTFCITALEMLALGIFPVTSRRGALTETLGDAERKGCAILLTEYGAGDREVQTYVDAVATVLEGKMWEKVGLDLERHSWSSVADEWLSFMHLG